MASTLKGSNNGKIRLNSHNNSNFMKIKPITQVKEEGNEKILWIMNHLLKRL